MRISGLPPLARELDRWRPNILRVLVYHRIGDPDGLRGDPKLISATPQQFDGQMGHVARHYLPIGVAELVQALQGHCVLPPQAVLVTFDDGYRDFLTSAWPILRSHGVPAVLFVPTAFPDSARRFYWDVVYEAIIHTERRQVALPEIGILPLRTDRARRMAIRKIDRYLLGQRPSDRNRVIVELDSQLGAPQVELPAMLTWEELRQLARAGLTVAPHTRTHAALPTLGNDELIEEIEGSHADLERALGESSVVFSYPYGLSDMRAFPYLRAKGIGASFTIEPALNFPGVTDPLLLCRIGVGPSASFTEFCLSLTSMYTAFRSQRYVQALLRRLGSGTVDLRGGTAETSEDWMSGAPHDQ